MLRECINQTSVKHFAISKFNALETIIQLLLNYEHFMSVGVTSFNGFGFGLTKLTNVPHFIYTYNPFLIALKIRINLSVS